MLNLIRQYRPAIIGMVLALALIAFYLVGASRSAAAGTASEVTLTQDASGNYACSVGGQPCQLKVVPYVAPAPDPTTAAPAPTPTATPTPSATATEQPAATSDETVITTAYTTGYGWWDNTPAGSSDISNPVIHKKAGGTGTYEDPVTVAVGHSIINGKDILDYPEGTKMYVPNLQKYFIVEDTCGDGSTPQNGPCHKVTASNSAPGATVWFDVWIGGSTATHTKSNNCESQLTDANGALHTVILNPAPNYKVVSGDILLNGTCRANYGNTAVTQ